MTTPIWITGAEYGLATPSSSGAGLVNSISGSVTIQGTTKRTGSYAFRFQQSGASAYMARSITADYYVGSIYVYFKDALPTGDTEIINGINTDGNLLIYFESTDSTLRATKSGTPITGPVVTYNTWYRIDFRFFTQATTHTIDWQVDGEAQTQYSIGSRSAVSMTSLRLGAANAYTSDTYIDDIVISTTSGDYPIGAHAVEGLRPSADGTHNNASNIMEDADGNDIDGSSYYAYSLLDENPWTSEASADRVQQTGNGTENYCEIQFADTAQTSIIGVQALLQYAAASTSGNTGGCIIRSGTTETTLWGAPGALADYSETSAFYKSVIVSPDGGSWSSTVVNALRCRFGYSGDANPDVYWLAIMLEVAYEEVTGTQYPQAVAGEFTSSGTLAIRTGKAVSGAFTSSGELARSTSKATLAGTFTSSGVLARLIGKATLAGEFTSSGVLAAVKTVLISLAGEFTSSGVLARLTGKAVSGEFTSSGALARSTSKATLAGTFTSSGVLARLISKATLAGAFTSSGVVATMKAALISLAGEFTSSGVLTRQIGKGLSGEFTSSGSLAKQIGKALSGAFTSSGVAEALKLATNVVLTIYDSFHAHWADGPVSWGFRQVMEPWWVMLFKWRDKRRRNRRRNQ